MSKRVNIRGKHRMEKVTGILRKKNGEYFIQTKFERNPETFEVPLEELLEDFDDQGVTIKVQSSPWGEGMFKTAIPPETIEFSQISVHPEYKFASPAAYEKFQDLKFGMMIHWGFYSQLGVTESWCANGTMTEQEFLDTYYTMWQVFNPVLFDADAWAALAERAGMQFFQFTTKHHDGFCMFDTKTTTVARKRLGHQGAMVGPVEDTIIHYSIMDSPFKRDIVGELIAAFRKRKLGIGLYYSNIDWNDPNFRWHSGSRVFDPTYSPQTHPEEWAAFIARQREQLREIFTNYGEIDQVFFDGSWPFVALKEMEEIILMIRQLQPNCMFSDRGLGPYGDFTSPERWIPADAEDSRIKGRLWQVCDPIHGSWAFIPGDQYKTKETLLHNLIDAIAKGGTYVFAISPMPTGVFPESTVRIMEYMGDWLKLYGEAIYNTRRWSRSKDPAKDIFYTRSKDGKWLYIMPFGVKESKISLEHLPIKAGSTGTLLGSNLAVAWNKTESGLEVEIPSEAENVIEQFPVCAFKFALED
jgi:alpha-L-fucosidase